MNSWTFSASIIRCYIEDEVAIIGIGDDDFQSRNFLILSRMLDAEPEDSGIGVQTSRSTREFINAIDSAELTNEQLLISIGENYSSSLGGSVIQIKLPGEGFERSMLIEYLHTLFDNGNVRLAVIK